jgi:hypothetical protein
LVDRSDTIAVKSEGIRVLVNVIRTLLSGRTTEDASPELERAIQLITQPEYSSYIINLLIWGQKYPLLINESLLALTLVAAHSNNGRPT